MFSADVGPHGAGADWVIAGPRLRELERSPEPYLRNSREGIGDLARVAAKPIRGQKLQEGLEVPGQMPGRLRVGGQFLRGDLFEHPQEGLGLGLRPAQRLDLRPVSLQHLNHGIPVAKQPLKVNWPRSGLLRLRSRHLLRQIVERTNPIVERLLEPRDPLLKVADDAACVESPRRIRAVRRNWRGGLRRASHRRISSGTGLDLLYNLDVKQTRPKTNLTRSSAQSQEAQPAKRRRARSASDKANGLPIRLLTRIKAPSSVWERAVVVTEADWLRMRAQIAELAVPRSYQGAGFMLAGSFVSFVCLCLTFLSSAVPTANWIWTVAVSVTCCSGVLSGACFLFDRSLAKGRSEKRHSFLKEVDQMRGRF